jgi:uncharacterized protein
MAAPQFEPTRLDVQAFAAHTGKLSGRWPQPLFERLVDAAASGFGPTDADTVEWQVRGEQRVARDGAPEIWLHLQASTALALECRRCLEPVQVPARIDTWLRFVRGEDAAAELDAESEFDVLALTRSLDLRELIEDELLLALPLVPAHEVCPNPLPTVAEAPEASPASNPFAALADLKRRGPVN